MIGLFPPRFQTTEELAHLLTNMFWYGYDESYINNFETNVNAVTMEKANAIIEKYFLKDSLQFVLIGKASEIKKVAAKYGSVTEVQIKDDIGKGFEHPRLWHRPKENISSAKTPTFGQGITKNNFQ